MQEMKVGRNGDIPSVANDHDRVGDSAVVAIHAMQNRFTDYLAIVVSGKGQIKVRRQHLAKPSAA